MTTTLTDDQANSRYLLRDASGKLLSAVDYARNGDSIALTHVFTPAPLRGHGYAADLMRAVVDELRTDARVGTVRPTCWYAAQWFDRHPEHADLLAGAGTQP